MPACAVVLNDVVYFKLGMFGLMFCRSIGSTAGNSIPRTVFAAIIVVSRANYATDSTVETK